MGNTHTNYVENHVYPSGNTYSGEMKGGKRHGTGVYTWSEDGCIYDGFWIDNQQNGQGTMTFKNGNKYVGSFYKNNIHGEGTLVTANGETIKGFFEFKNRFLTIDGPKYPVSNYVLNVDVTSRNGKIVAYRGPATLHVYTGLLVLPGMSKPDVPIYDAIIIVDQNGIDSQFAVAENQVPVAAAVAVPAEAVQNTIPTEQGYTTGVAFGVQDEAHQKEVRYKSKPVNAFDPRNYF